MLLRLRDITLLVDGRPAFEHTSLDIRKGEHWAILGPTGAGKSLLAGVINRRVAIHRGEVAFFFDEPPGSGRPYLQPGEILTLSAETHRFFLSRHAGYHQARWQSIEGLDDVTVQQLLGSVPAAGPVRAKEVVALLGLEHLLPRKVLHLSHGESRKAHLAVLLLQRPRLLILDDPYVGLDAHARTLLSGAIEDLLGREAPQVLLLTSKAEEIPARIQRVLLVDRLRVQASGTPGAVLPRHRPDELAAPEPHTAGSPALPGVLSGFAEALRETSPGLTEMVRMDGVSVRYGGVDVLRNISWRVLRGERWSLSGPNGAGKTTLLSLILADNPQGYANDVFLFGRRRGSGESIWEIKRNIGWVSPELHIHYPPGCTCFAVVASGFHDSAGLHQVCTPQQTGTVHAWLEAFGLRDSGTRPFHSLSSGQQRLVLLARALVKHPPLLILDEACQGLDPAHRRAFVALIDAICRSTAVTLLYVTHDPDELPQSITHRLRLDRGEAVECGPVR